MRKYVAKMYELIKYIRELCRLCKPILRESFKQHNEVHQMRTALLAPQSSL